MKIRKLISIILSIFFITTCGCIENSSSANIDNLNYDNVENYITSILESTLGEIKLSGISKGHNEYTNITTLTYNISKDINIDEFKKLSSYLQSQGWQENQFTVSENGAILTFKKGNKTLAISYSKYPKKEIVVTYVENNSTYLSKYINKATNDTNYGKTAKSFVNPIRK
ncbi:hypothetical protein MFS40622_1526 [Methanocaldococcus sp. FS406-22]|uniref:hypothetical protein n=1 Tax=Methanocaldococcus sp. (strain FS406-22) TaxID=644281 RepID=UPI0001BF178D|nr:hypothetical protein [Methanocaldococcus sp. FS406-22]ADC70198.1 hypothetical protein MFS40622_1526 [Methanocaldococcus sp. FS406-22]